MPMKLLLILLLGAQSACAGAKPERLEPKAGAGPAAGLDAVIDKVMATGLYSMFHIEYGKNLSQLFDIPLDQRIYFRFVEPGNTLDNVQRAFVVIMSSAADRRPESAVLMSLRWDTGAREKEDVYLRVSLKGEPVRGFSCLGKITEDGAYVKGSCVPKPMALDAPETAAFLRRDLDFWIRGKSRSPKALKPVVVIDGTVPAETYWTPPAADAVPEGGARQH